MAKDRKNEKNKKEENKEVDYKELYLRASADFQNYKRRVESERVVWIRSAQKEVIEPLLSVLDDLDRAIDACEKQDSKESKTLKDGLELTLKNVKKIFADLGVEEIDCSGDFNPEFHEAMLRVQSDDHEEGEIVDVLSKGYMLHSHVLRHAKVSVAS